MGRQEKVLREVLRILGLQTGHENLPLLLRITLLVSIDLEVSRHERHSVRCSGSNPSIRELGIAILDTRQIFMPAPWPPQGSRLIETHQFSTTQASADFEDCDVTDFKECGFVETFCVSQDQIVSTLNRCIRAKRTEHVILIGHSIQRDLAILRAKGFDDTHMTTIDTHQLSHAIFGKMDRKPTKFTLSGILSHLQYPFTRHELHNAGNDATFTLYAMLGLAVTHEQTSRRQDVSEKERENLELLQLFIDREVGYGKRWKPIRRALGAHMRQDD